MSDNNLVFIDTEFTNLDPRLGDLIEAAWAVNDGDVRGMLFEHTLEHASPEALKINRYFERGLERFCGDGRGVTPMRMELIKDLTGATIVAENYGIDCAKLLTKLGFEPWHYRKIELSSVALTVFNLGRPESLTDTAARLRRFNYPIPENDHSAGGDVECLRACYNALREIRDAGPDFMDEAAIA